MQNVTSDHAQNSSKYIIVLLMAAFCLFVGVALFTFDGAAASAANLPVYSAETGVVTGTAGMSETAVVVTMTSSSSHMATDPLTIVSAIVILGTMTYVALQAPSKITQ